MKPQVNAAPNARHANTSVDRYKGFVIGTWVPDPVSSGLGAGAWRGHGGGSAQGHERGPGPARCALHLSAPCVSGGKTASAQSREVAR